MRPCSLEASAVDRRASPPNTSFGFIPFAKRTEDLTGPERLRLFTSLPTDWQEQAFERLAAAILGGRVADGEIDLRRRRPAAASPQRSGCVHPPSPRFPGNGDEGLRTISPPAYVEALAGAEVPPHGTIRCPLPDHEDRMPSFHAWPDPERGVWCFGCQRGGDIYSFAAALWGLNSRRDFPELHRRLASELLGRAVA